MSNEEEFWWMWWVCYIVNLIVDLMLMIVWGSEVLGDVVSWVV